MSKKPAPKQLATPLAPSPDVSDDESSVVAPIFQPVLDSALVEVANSRVDTSGPRVSNMMVPVYQVNVGGENLEMSGECADSMLTAYNSLQPVASDQAGSSTQVSGSKKLIGFRVTSPKKFRNQPRFKGVGGWHSNPLRKQQGKHRKYRYRGPACMYGLHHYRYTEKVTEKPRV